LTRRRILVMDDEEIIREIVDEVLTGFGYDVTLTAEGLEAVQCYEESLKAGNPYDAAILDLTVRGGAGGLEAMQRLRGLDPGVTAVVSSGYANDPIMKEYETYGFKGVISKPYRFEDLDNLLQQVCSEKDG
jgi:two-component system cell cycle sensor histidine kinase/response regulator CckA